MTVPKGYAAIILPMLKAPRPSKSGKNLTFLTTGGIMRTNVEYDDGRPISIGVNGFFPA